MSRTLPTQLAIAGLFLVGLATFEQAPAEASAVTFSVNAFGETRSVTLEDLGVRLVEKEDVGLLDTVRGKRYDLVWDLEESDTAVRALWGVSAPSDAHFVYENGVLQLEKEVLGATMELEEFLSALERDYPDLGSYSLETTTPELFSEQELAPFMSQVNTLLARGLAVTVDGGEPFTFQMQSKDLKFSRGEDGVVRLTLGEPFVEYVIATLSDRVYSEPSHLRILEANPDQVDQVVSEGSLANGRQLLVVETEEAIQSEVASGGTDAVAVMEVLSAQIINETEHDLGTFEFLGRGQSWFAQSAWGRGHNIRKGLSDHMDGLLIPPGAEFSFNDFVGPISVSAGWAESKVIYKGELEEQLGGGLCQVSTTVYRAALDLALDVTEQRGHSLYVLYYQEFGDGLDATVYPGEQNLKFINTTPGYLYLHAYTTDDEMAYVDFYGVDDGRSTTLEGPYSASTQTDEVIAGLGGKPLQYYELAWRYTITWGDGTVETRWIRSAYKGKVKQNHPVTVM